MSEEREKKIGHWLTVAFLFVFGTGLLVWTGWSEWMQQRSASWPSVPATLIGAGIDVDQDDDGDTTYSPSISYRYQVEGQLYESTRIGFVSSGDYDRDDQNSVGRVVDGWVAKKAELRAWYDPKKPSQSVLVPGGNISWFTLLGMLVISGGMIVIALWMIKTGPS